MKNILSFIFMLSVIFLSCGKPDDRAELLDRVRALGINPDPLISQPDVVTKVTVYLALPLGKEILIEPFEDDATGPFVVAPLSSITIENSTESKVYKDYSGFRLLTIQASIQVPSSEVMGEKTILRYGFVINFNKIKKYMIGRLIVSSENTSNFDPIDFEIINPKDKSVLKEEDKIDIKSNIISKNDEFVTYGWFVTGGEIEDRRSLKTTWQTPKKGAHSLIMTVRGQSSQSFAIKIIEINVE